MEKEAGNNNKTPKALNSNSRIPKTRKSKIQVENNQISLLTEKLSEDIKDPLNLEDLIKNAIVQWKKEFDNLEVKTDSIGDLERLIKLRYLIKDEKEKNQDFLLLIMSKVIEIIQDVVEDGDLRIKIYEHLKEIKIG